MNAELKYMYNRVSVEFRKYAYRPFKRVLDPFVLQRSVSLIIHCSHHKAGTIWLKRILRDIASQYGLPFHSDQGNELIRQSGIFLDHHSKINVETLPEYIGSHMIRDPRDIIISRYFYHLWTKEQWANMPDEKLGGMSYKSYLNSLSQAEGIAFEIERVSECIEDMVSWNYNNPKMYEIKYEDLIQNSYAIFEALFKHYGFKRQAVERSCLITKKYNFSAMTQRRIGEINNGVHLRSGASGQWRQYFSEFHKSMFKRLYPHALQILGYEKNETW